MIISKILNSKYVDKEDLVWGLVGGLVGGLVLGLVWGLVGGLVVGLVGGLVVGLVWGLVVGLVWGLVVGLVWGLVTMLINFPEAFPFLVGFYPILFLILGFIILTEFLFLLDNLKPTKKENKLWFTIKRKLEAGFEVLLGFSLVGYIYILSREFGVYGDEILTWIGYVGVGVLALGVMGFIFYIWIKLNSLRYEKP